MSHYTALAISLDPLTAKAHELLALTKDKNFQGNKSFRILLSKPDHINPNIVDLLDQHGLYIRFAELFYTTANRNALIHIDGRPDEYTTPGNMGKVNFISGGHDSVMNWYKPIVEKTYTPTNQNKYIGYESYEVECIESRNLMGYYIVQTGIPHNITTHTDSRYCVSMTLGLKNKEPLMIPYETLVTMLDSLSISSAASSNKSAIRSGLPSVTDNLPGI